MLGKPQDGGLGSDARLSDQAPATRYEFGPRLIQINAQGFTAGAYAAALAALGELGGGL